MGNNLIELAVSIGVALIVLALLAGVAWTIFRGFL